VNELASLFTIAPKTKGDSKSDGAGKSLGSKPDKIHLVSCSKLNKTLPSVEFHLALLLYCFFSDMEVYCAYNGNIM
jgi:hypothetical protein